MGDEKIVWCGLDEKTVKPVALRPLSLVRGSFLNVAPQRATGDLCL